MLRKLTVKVDADISSLLFLSSFYQSATLGRPSGFSLIMSSGRDRSQVRGEAARSPSFDLSLDGGF